MFSLGDTLKLLSACIPLFFFQLQFVFMFFNSILSHNLWGEWDYFPRFRMEEMETRRGERKVTLPLKNLKSNLEERQNRGERKEIISSNWQNQLKLKTGNNMDCVNVSWKCSNFPHNELRTFWGSETYSLYTAKEKPPVAPIRLAAPGSLGLKGPPTIRAVTKKSTPSGVPGLPIIRRQMETVLAANREEQANHQTFDYNRAHGNKHSMEQSAVSSILLCRG